MSEIVIIENYYITGSFNSDTIKAPVLRKIILQERAIEEHSNNLNFSQMRIFS